MLLFCRHGEHSGRRSRGARSGPGVTRANGNAASRLHGKRSAVDGRDFASSTRRLDTSAIYDRFFLFSEERAILSREFDVY